MKNKKILLIVLPIVLIVIIGVVFAVLYFTTDIFKSDSELFWNYMLQNSDVENILVNDNYTSQNELKTNNSYNSTGNLIFSLEQGESSSKYFNIATTARHDINTGRTYADATLKNGDIDLFNVSYINSGDIYAIKSSDVADAYVGVRNSGLKELAAKYNISTDLVPDTVNFNEYTSVLDLTDEQKDHLYNTYLPIVVNEIGEDQYTSSNENIQIGELTYNANVYQASITGEQFKQILINSLNTLKEDTETMVLISNKASTLRLGIEYTDITNLTMHINELIEIIQSANITNNVNISIYENYDQTIRTVIDIDNLLDITYDRVDGNQTLTIDMVQGGIESMLSNTNVETYDVQNANDSLNTIQDDSIAETGSNIIDAVSTNSTDSDITSVENQILVEGNTLTDNTMTENIINENVTNDVSSGDTNTINEAIDDENVTDTNIIDLQTATDEIGTENQESVNITRLVFSKENNDQNISNTIILIPDYSETEETSSITLTYTFSSVIDNSINNSYNLTIENIGPISSEVMSFEYTTNTVRADQVEEIEELNESNTVIMNNYEADQFRTFITAWYDAFQSVLSDKLSTIGIEDEDISGLEENNAEGSNTEEGTEGTGSTPDE